MVVTEHRGVKGLNLLLPRMLGQLLEQASADAASLHRISDEKGSLGSRRIVRVTDILGHRDNPPATLCDQRELAGTIRLEQPLNRAATAPDTKEARMDATLGECTIELVQRRRVRRSQRSETDCRSIS